MLSPSNIHGTLDVKLRRFISNTFWLTKFFNVWFYLVQRTLMVNYSMSADKNKIISYHIQNNKF